MKAKFPEGYGKYNEYDFDNRISYDEEADSMYIYVAPPQGRVGAVMVYRDKQGNMVSINKLGVIDSAESKTLCMNLKTGFLNQI